MLKRKPLPRREALNLGRTFIKERGGFPERFDLEFARFGKEGETYFSVQSKPFDGRRYKLAFLAVLADGRVVLKGDHRRDVPDYEKLCVGTLRPPTLDDRVAQFHFALMYLKEKAKWCTGYQLGRQNGVRPVPVIATARVLDKEGKVEVIYFAIALSPGIQKDFNRQLGATGQKDTLVMHVKEDDGEDDIAHRVLLEVTKLRREQWGCRD